MQRGLGTLLAVGALLFGVYYGLTHSRSDTQAGAQPQNADAKGTAHVVSVSGPLANLFSKQKPAPPSYHGAQNMVASDHIGNSPVGTGNSILHKTFRVAGSVDVPFEVPAHAASPQLHGAFHSYVQAGGEQSSDTTADLDFLVLNEQQHADFLSGRASEAVFSAEDAHDQEVNFNMPSTFDQPAKYFLIFRNPSDHKSTDKKVVQADFTMDF